jgi:hypothetical protein
VHFLLTVACTPVWQTTLPTTSITMKTRAEAPANENHAHHPTGDSNEARAATTVVSLVFISLLSGMISTDRFFIL